jgi:3',5'-cyclic AMP phosphodiesterase CpdA
MNILHISDLHFGPWHWKGDNELLLAKLNSYSSDLVINTGDSTSDGLEAEFKAARGFLEGLRCPHRISLIGNHDKRVPAGPALFREYLGGGEFISPLRPADCHKPNIFLEPAGPDAEGDFTDLNFIKRVKVGAETLVLIGLDSTEMARDNGVVDLEMLRSVAQRVGGRAGERIVLLIHHSILDSDSDPLFNSWRVIDFVRQLGIEHVFCGHTHKLALMRSTDLVHRHTFAQYKNGSLTSSQTPYDSNMFLFFENFAASDMVIHVVRPIVDGGRLRFEEELLRDTRG